MNYYQINMMVKLKRHKVSERGLRFFLSPPGSRDKFLVIVLVDHSKFSLRIFFRPFPGSFDHFYSPLEFVTK